MLSAELYEVAVSSYRSGPVHGLLYLWSPAGAWDLIGTEDPTGADLRTLVLALLDACPTVQWVRLVMRGGVNSAESLRPCLAARGVGVRVTQAWG